MTLAHPDQSHIYEETWETRGNRGSNNCNMSRKCGSSKPTCTPTSGWLGYEARKNAKKTIEGTGLPRPYDNTAVLQRRGIPRVGVWGLELLFERSEFLIATCKKKKADSLCV